MRSPLFACYQRKNWRDWNVRAGRVILNESPLSKPPTTFAIPALPVTDSAELPDFSRGGGLLPAIAQDAETGEVLMMAWMNRAAFDLTCSTGRAVYYSRSRGKLWHKGEESGHFQEVEQILVDCDGDTILLKVRQIGDAACHTGHRSCFFRAWNDGNWKNVGRIVFDPQQVYRQPHP